MKKQVYTYEKDIKVGLEQFGNTTFSLSKYADCLIIIANQTGSLGSIVLARLCSWRDKLSNPQAICRNLIIKKSRSRNLHIYMKPAFYWDPLK